MNHGEIIVFVQELIKAGFSEEDQQKIYVAYQIATGEI